VTQIVAMIQSNAMIEFIYDMFAI